MSPLHGASAATHLGAVVGGEMGHGRPPAVLATFMRAWSAIDAVEGDTVMVSKASQLVGSAPVGHQPSLRSAVSDAVQLLRSDPSAGPVLGVVQAEEGFDVVRMLYRADGLAAPRIFTGEPRGDELTGTITTTFRNTSDLGALVAIDDRFDRAVRAFPAIDASRYNI